MMRGEVGKGTMARWDGKLGQYQVRPSFLLSLCFTDFFS
jgi:hypothetical protein